jgi:hypothetical protein
MTAKAPKTKLAVASVRSGNSSGDHDEVWWQRQQYIVATTMQIQQW